MTNYYARPTRNRGAGYQALLADQATATGHSLEDLQELDTLASIQDAQAGASSLVVVDQPAPTRGYALLPTVDPDAVYGRAHVLKGQPDDVYRALFSAARVRANQIAQRAGITGTLPIRFEPGTLATHVADAITRLGEPYAVEINDPDSATLTMPDNRTPGLISEATAAQIDQTGGVIITTRADGTQAAHAHVTPAVEDGDTVQAGQIIGYRTGAPLPENEQHQDAPTTGAPEPTDEEHAALTGDDTPAGATDEYPEGDTEHEDAQSDEIPANPWDDTPEGENTPQADNDDAEADATEEEITNTPTSDDTPDTVCPDCGQEFSAPRYVKQHRKAKHGITA